MLLQERFQYLPPDAVTNSLLPFWQTHLGSQDARPGLENTEVGRNINVGSQRETASPRAIYDTVRDHPAVVKYPTRQLQIQFCFPLVKKNLTTTTLSELIQSTTDSTGAQIHTATASDSKNQDYKIIGLTPSGTLFAFQVPCFSAQA